jgi:hypothetical protein
MSSRPRPAVTAARSALGRLTLAGLFVLALVAGASAQIQNEVAKQLRVEWDTPEEAWTRPRIVGHVYNDSEYRIGSVRLRIEILDASKQVVRHELAWIYVNVPARSRAQFAVRRPAGEAFRVAVESFFLIAREGMSDAP